MYRAAIFDMDGTILDTIQDMTDSMNHALTVTGHQAGYTAEDMKHFFGSGVHVAVQRVLAAEKGASPEVIEAIGNGYDVSELGITPELVRTVQDVFAPWYAAHCNIKTGPFPGLAEAMTRLKERGIRTAVVSNKNDDAVQILVEEHFPGNFEFALGVTAALKRKPAPDMTWKIMEDMGVTKEETVYIGDSEVDAATAANSGVDAIIVGWGFRDREYLKEHGIKDVCGTMDEMVEKIIGQA